MLGRKPEECVMWNLFKENREQRLRWVLWCTWYTLFYKCKHLTRLYTSPSPLRGLLSFENAIWKPIPTFPIGKELKQQISSLKRKQMVSPFSLEGDGGGYIFSKKMIGFSLMSLWCRLLKTCFHKDSSIKSLKEQNALIIFIFFLNNKSV